jgi:energy-coupling factor transport system permease protein
VSNRGFLHPLAWLAWLAAVVVLVSATRNPFYLGLALAWVLAVRAVLLRALPPEMRPAVLPLSPLRFGLVVVPIAALFNALFVHAGATVLFTLPPGWPLVGGPVTTEALAYGALNGLLLTILFAAFNTVNLAVHVRALLQMAPRAYYPLAVTMAIAVTFVPSTVRQAGQIREAQAIRGAPVRGLRSWLPLLLPLLGSGLERALQLAEAMTARGYAGGDTQGGDWRPQAFVLAGMAAVLAGWVVPLAWDAPWAGAALVLGGLALVGAALWLAGRNHPHTLYRPAPWQGRDWLVAAAAAVPALACLLPLPGLDRSSLYYYPYPALAVPGFSAALGVATWGLLAPAAVILFGKA